MAIGYITGIWRAIAGINFWWWIAGLFSAFLGIGFAREYPIARDTANDWFGVSVMPENIWQALGTGILVWLVLGLLHKEAMRHCRAGRIIFDDLFVTRNQPLYKLIEQSNGKRFKRPVHAIDIGKVVVRNVPYDSLNGKGIHKAHAAISVFDSDSKKLVKEVRHLRWQDNPKPDGERHYPDEWKFRTLDPNGNKNTIQFLVKHVDQNCAFGVQGNSQLEFSDWCNPELYIDPGNYLVRMTVQGNNIYPGVLWFSLRVGGENQSFDVKRCKPPKLNEGQPWRAANT